MKPVLKIGAIVVAMLALYWGVWHVRQDYATQNVTLQLKWLTQTQFAGYYVALDKGFYAEENLDVTIKPGGPGIATPEVLAEGGADVIVDWMPSALVARENGVPLVHIAQPFESSGMMLICRRDRGVTSPVHFRGKRIGVWLAGNEYPFLSWMSRLGFATDGGPDGVEIVEQGGDVDILSSGAADCISMLTYGFWQIEKGGFDDDNLAVFRYEDQGVSTLEDGLYVLQDDLQDPAFVDKMARFVRASMRGWRHAEANQAEAVEIVLSHDDTGRLDKPTQDYMMREVAKLTGGSDGLLRVSDFWRTANSLLYSGENPVIRDIPENAWTRAVTDRAFSPDG